MKSNLETIDVYLHTITEKAYRVSLDGDTRKSVWVPKSQCELEKRTARALAPTIWLTAPQWLLEEKGLV